MELQQRKQVSCEKEEEMACNKDQGPQPLIDVLENVPEKRHRGEVSEQIVILLLAYRGPSDLKDDQVIG